MSRYMIPLPTVVGLLSSQAGQSFTVTTPAYNLTAVRVDLTVTDAGASDTVVTIANGTSTETVTIAAGSKFATVNYTDAYAAGAAITLTVDSGDAMNLSGLILVDDAAATSVPAGLVTLSEVKTALGISGVTSYDEAYLNRQIDLVSERARAYTGRYLNQALHEETFFAPSSITLAAYPVASISSVTKDGAALVAGDIRADLSRGRIWQPSGEGRFDWRGTEKVVVNYTAGYNPLPAGIVEWAYIAIKAGWDAWPADRGFAPGGKTERKFDFPDAGAVEYSLGRNPILPDWLARAPMSALDPWVDPSLRYSDEYAIYQRL